MNLSVVVPCYNEEKNIPLVVKRFAEILPHDLKAELVLVDNGSKDGSNALIRELMKTHAFLRIAEVKTNIGYGFGIWSGLKEAKGEFICWTHADMQTDLNDTIKAYRIITAQPDAKNCFVKGERQGRPLFDQAFTTFMSWFETLYLGTVLHDINAQPNLFHRSFFEKFKQLPNDFSFDLCVLYLAKRTGLRLIRFPVLFTKRIHGESHWNTGIKSKFKFIKRTLDFSFKLDAQLKEQGYPMPGFFRKYFGLVKEFAHIPFIKFCFFGGISTIINYGVFYALFQLFGINYLISSATGYVSGVLFSFPFNRSETFQSNDKPLWALAKYFMVYTFSLGVNLALLFAFVQLIGIPALFAKAMVIVITTLTNFFGCKLFVFKKSKVAHEHMP